MALKKVTAHTEAFSSVHKFLSDRVPGDQTWMSNDQENSKPHRIYMIDPVVLVRTRSFRHAEAVGWRFIQVDERKRLCAFEVIHDPKSKRHRFSEANYGSATGEHAAALEKAAVDPKVEGMEHAYIRSSSLKIHAVWLKRAFGRNEYFIPLSPCFHGLVQGRMYTTREFLDILLPVARKVIAMAESEKGDAMRGG